MTKFTAGPSLINGTILWIVCFIELFTADSIYLLKISQIKCRFSLITVLIVYHV